MWPSATSNRIFGNVACPSGAACEMPHCIFSHDPPVSPAELYSPSRIFSVAGEEPEAKRRRIDDDIDQFLEENCEVLQVAEEKPSIFVGYTLPKNKVLANDASQKASSVEPVANQDPPPVLPKSMVRAVSPPPTATANSKPDSKPVPESDSKPDPKADTPVALMPRKFPKEPTTFTKRVTLLKALHGYMKPHNDKLLRAVKPEVKALHLTANQLNKLAVDEEEKIAEDHPHVYENILKQRLVKLKGMSIEDWVKERREADVQKRGLPPKKPPPKRVNTGLTPAQELDILPMIECKQDGLDEYGYVLEPSTEDEITDARLTLEAADHWEKCDRCDSRFQVFPDRREEDGALTSGGQCTHHWGKRIYGRKGMPTVLSCCQRIPGAPRCTTADTHVFTDKSVKRLSLIMPFIRTPENDKVPKDTAVCFDCEMGYTTHGLELLRLTVLSWPTHRPIIDVLVKPFGHILDLNTRFSGVTPEQFFNAKPFDPANPKPNRNDLRIVESPYAARDLFLSHVSPKTAVLGHALENDLNTIRLIHPFIVDTVLLFPTHQGLPYRNSLRALAQKHLNDEIQQGGEAGHDSFEDAKTTGELVRVKVKKAWERLQSEGFFIRNGEICAPPNLTPPRRAPPPPSMVPAANMAVLPGKPAEKRKLEEDESEQGGDQPPSKK